MDYAQLYNSAAHPQRLAERRLERVLAEALAGAAARCLRRAPEPFDERRRARASGSSAADRPLDRVGGDAVPRRSTADRRVP